MLSPSECVLEKILALVRKANIASAYLAIQPTKITLTTKNVQNCSQKMDTAILPYFSNQKVELRQAETWDLGPFAAVLAPRQRFPAVYKGTVRD